MGMMEDNIINLLLNDCRCYVYKINSKTFFLKVINEYRRKIIILFREFYDKEIIIDKEELINKNKLINKKIFLMNLEELNPKNKLRLKVEVSFYLYFEHIRIFMYKFIIRYNI